MRKAKGKEIGVKKNKRFSQLVGGMINTGKPGMRR